MTEPLLRPSGVFGATGATGVSGVPGCELLEVDRLRLVEAAAPSVPAGDLRAMDRVWAEAVQANPTFFDGPVTACAGVEWEEPRSLVVAWVRTSFRFYALRRVPGATSWLPALFVSVLQPTDDGRLLVGRMSASTSHPGRWLLPGGSMEPPPGEHQPLDTAALRRHAARELIEETGIDTSPDELTLWVAARGEFGNVGVLFLAPPRPAALVHERFAALAAAETALGRDPELDRIVLLGSPAELADLDGPHVDYLEPVVRRYAATALHLDA